MPQKNTDRIHDSHVHTDGHDIFVDASQLSNGSLRFRMASGEVYEAPLSYFHQWYNKGPHEKVDPPSPELTDKVVGFEYFYDNNGVRLTFSNGHVFYVAWDVVLMSLEPRYEHFGGFTEYSKEMTRRYWDSKNEET